MYKKRVLSIVISLFMVFSIFFLAACNPSKLPPTTSGDSSSGGDGGGDNDDDTPATSEYIEGITILYRPDANSTNDKFKDGVTGQELTFNQLLNRQISYLSYDILYRLVSLYGYGYDSVDQSINLGNDTVDSGSGAPLEYNLYTASYLAYNAIADYNDGDYIYKNGDYAGQSVEDVLTNFGYMDLTQPESWAYSMLASGSLHRYNTLEGSYGDDNPLVRSFTFINKVSSNVKSVIDGYGFLVARLEEEFSFAGYRSGTEPDRDMYKWLWNSGNTVADVSTMFESYYESLKYAISILLATGEYNRNGDFEYDTMSYNANLNNINHLGILSYEKSVLKNFIKDVIIGRDNVAHDNEILLLLDSYDLKTNFEKFDVTNEEYNDLSEAEINIFLANLEDYNKMHQYKAYELMVNTIVDRVVAHTFENTSSGTPIYAEMPRVLTSFISFEDIDEGGEEYFTDPSLNIKSIIFMPKDIMQLKFMLLNFQSYNNEPTFYVNANITFVANGQSYSATQSTSVKPGEAGADDGNGGFVDNSFGVDVEDLFGSQFANGKIPLWGAYDGTRTDQITTLNNPYTITQEDSIATTINFDGGNNYIEMAFNFFQDSEMQNLLSTTPQYGFGVIDFDFEWEDFEI